MNIRNETHFKCSFYDRDEIFRNKRKEKLLFSWFVWRGQKRNKWKEKHINDVLIIYGHVMHIRYRKRCFFIWLPSSSSSTAKGKNVVVMMVINILLNFVVVKRKKSAILWPTFLGWKQIVTKRKRWNLNEICFVGKINLILLRLSANKENVLMHFLLQT